jgi:hypothetical protein
LQNTANFCPETVIRHNRTRQQKIQIETPLAILISKALFFPIKYLDPEIRDHKGFSNLKTFQMLTSALNKGNKSFKD